MTGDSIRSIVVLVLSIGQFVASSLLFSGRDFEAQTADGPVAAVQDLATPAGYAFIIWFPIYLASIVYGVVQALPSQRTGTLHRHTGWWMALTFGSVILWLVFARFGPAILTIPIIVVQFAGVAIALVIGTRLGFEGRLNRWITAPVFGVFAGWLTAATVLNATNILPEYGVSIFGLSGVPLAYFTLVVASAMALVMLGLSRGQIAYMLTLLWAQVGIIVSNLTMKNEPAVAIGAGVAIALILGATVLIRRQAAT